MSILDDNNNYLLQFTCEGFWKQPHSKGQDQHPGSRPPPLAINILQRKRLAPIQGPKRTKIRWKLVIQERTI